MLGGHGRAPPMYAPMTNLHRQMNDGSYQGIPPVPERPVLERQMAIRMD